MKLFTIFAALMIISLNCYAQSGRILLNNGNELSGDIERQGDSSYIVTYGNCAMRFEKNEIKKIIPDKKQKKNTIKEAFANSLKITPGGRFSDGMGPSTPYDETINKAATKHSLDPALIKAVIKAESNFKASDISYKGACGLMQLMPATAKILGVKNIFSSDENIHAGSRYLKDMLYIYNGNLDMALAAYNAGPGAVNRYKSIPPYKETIAYVKTVQRFYKKYKQHTPKVVSYIDENGCLSLYNVK